MCNKSQINWYNYIIVVALSIRSNNVDQIRNLKRSGYQIHNYSCIFCNGSLQWQFFNGRAKKWSLLSNNEYMRRKWAIGLRLPLSWSSRRHRLSDPRTYYWWSNCGLACYIINIQILYHDNVAKNVCILCNWYLLKTSLISYDNVIVMPLYDNEGRLGASYESNNRYEKCIEVFRTYWVGILWLCK